MEQFTARLAELCPAPARILDLGCGTGEIAAAISQMGYPVTACDFAEEMMAVARRNYARTPVDWVGLEPEWKALPFADASFDGIVASSVFEYLDDVPRVAAELSRVLRPEGVLLLTVPNPCNSVRKLEGRLRSMRLVQQVSSALAQSSADRLVCRLPAPFPEPLRSPGVAIRSERRALCPPGPTGFLSGSLAASGSRAAGPVGREKSGRGRQWTI